ncbi:uncharacterized protein LOC126746775 isoform X2 [Anthonomus grandis grandis]|nr:uncharacterized protein LOC126746775 isoform X2 [Anthonomus grandis grandis]XP_050311095.1 uncharacterized protein LOC126746775 isoform X2 [Anthonomus grandis grandis]XP_050311096.1 uncharacterized protein LOC126746775 isoform X2 [Anthonomus grandis grandis]XP_050311097.1 uncharacterized protein LOC126746775 isoform X2 [Anthonomus grandis grandis]XP_050311098.1 uncharacterized protein LOC126746775 isoform X2 [Anthonomus grandis grandis]XP_050311099.1 uncharacterized protein LOC126746775 iso
MEECCNTHDICYDTCNADKEVCDLDFKRCLYRHCDGYSKSVGGQAMTKTCKGLVRQIDLEIGEDELLKCCKTNSHVEILDAKRLNRKIIKNGETNYEPTGTVLFTFKGVYLPKSITFYRLERPISIYISPVTQCFRCLRFGHTRNNCKGKERCFNCAKETNENSEEEHSTCNTQCLYCKDNHKSTDKKCPEYMRQKNIKELMAYENITFYDASESIKKTYIPRDEFIYRPNDFPNIKNNNKNKGNSQDNLITPSQRRTEHYKSDPIKRSFQQVLTENSKKKRIMHKGYDKKAHEENLIFPNSRPQKEDKSQKQNMTVYTQAMTNSPMPSTSALHNQSKFESHTSTYPENIENIIHTILNMSEKNKKTIKDILFNPNYENHMDLGSDSHSDSNY